MTTALQVAIPWFARRHQTIMLNSSTPKFNKIKPYDQINPEWHVTQPTGANFSSFRNPPLPIGFMASPFTPIYGNLYGPESGDVEYYLPSNQGRYNLEIPYDYNGQDFSKQYINSYDQNQSPTIGLIAGDYRLSIPEGDQIQYPQRRNVQEWVNDRYKKYEGVDFIQTQVRFPFTAFVRRRYLNKDHNPQTGASITCTIGVTFAQTVIMAEKITEYLWDGRETTKPVQTFSKDSPNENKNYTVSYEFTDDDNPANDNYYEKIVWSDWITIGSTLRGGKFSYNDLTTGRSGIAYKTTTIIYSDLAFPTALLVDGYNLDGNLVWTSSASNRGFWNT